MMKLNKNTTNLLAFLELLQFLMSKFYYGP